MALEGNGIPNGWPLGLGNMNSRIGAAVDTSQQAAPQQPTTASRMRRSSSFSSLSSSNLDTESTSSFFPDQSVSLGRLIGIKPANKGRVYSERSHHRKIPDEKSHLGVAKGHQNSQGLCAPLLHHVIGKRGRSGNYSRC